ncbi:MAG: alpha/beta hydrolase [Sphingomonas sp.]|nr:alpha/beta hydrolase [Sphingomonas sp.]
MTELAHDFTPGEEPTLIFLPGYASDRSGTKALALEAWARGRGRGYLRFDYRGCGKSPGAFEDFTLADWRDDVLAMIDRTPGPLVLIGSSMGGWLMLLAAKARPDRVVGLVGIAAAPDFTDWGFTTEEKLALLNDGRLERPSPYGPAPTVYTRGFWMAGEANRVMHGNIAIDAPVRLLHGMADADVPFMRSVYLAQQLRSADVQLHLVKDGDHRLSREADIARLIALIEDL